jgi:2,3-diketo-5-methylthio-1-phosphopentane phosphatase
MEHDESGQTMTSTTGERLTPVRVFCDFDGTISTLDIGYDLFDRFGTQSPGHDELLSGDLDIRDYWRWVVSTLDDPLTFEALDTYLDSIPMDPSFGELVQLLKEEEVPLTVLSDGLDIYVDRFLQRHGYNDIPVICNTAEVLEDGTLEVTFPYAADGCSCPSAVCKRNYLLTSSAPDERIVYIGDGLSDFCPSTCADYVFAKGSLAAHCNREGIPHHSWTTLSEVVPELRKMLSSKRLKGRRQAELARKRIWESG